MPPDRGAIQLLLLDLLSSFTTLGKPRRGCVSLSQSHWCPTASAFHKVGSSTGGVYSKCSSSWALRLAHGSICEHRWQRMRWETCEFKSHESLCPGTSGSQEEELTYLWVVTVFLKPLRKHERETKVKNRSQRPQASLRNSQRHGKFRDMWGLAYSYRDRYRDCCWYQW